MLFSKDGKQIEIVIFDLDGVVVFPWKFAEFLEREHGITRQQTRNFFVGPFNNCLKAVADLKTLLPPFLDEWNWTGSVDQFVDTWLQTENCPDHSLVSFIQELRKGGLICGLGTNQERNRANYIRKEMGFEDLFDYLFFSCELQAMKPERAFFDRAREIINRPAASILFIDNEEHYVDAARGAGWNAELYTTFEKLFQEDSRFFVVK